MEEGIELLTGIPAGSSDARGDYPSDSVYGRVQKRLAKMARDAREALKAERDEAANGLTATGAASP